MLLGVFVRKRGRERFLKTKGHFSENSKELNFSLVSASM